jgi:hypothetical protein
VPLFPLFLPLTWLIWILSIAVLGGGAPLLRLWVTGTIAGTACPALAEMTVLSSIAGRWIVLGLLARPGLDERRDLRTGSVQRLLSSGLLRAESREDARPRHFRSQTTLQGLI